MWMKNLLDKRTCFSLSLLLLGGCNSENPISQPIGDSEPDYYSDSAVRTRDSINSHCQSIQADLRQSTRSVEWVSSPPIVDPHPETIIGSASFPLIQDMRWRYQGVIHRGGAEDNILYINGIKIDTLYVEPYWIEIRIDSIRAEEEGSPLVYYTVHREQSQRAVFIRDKNAAFNAFAHCQLDTVAIPPQTEHSSINTSTYPEGVSHNPLFPMPPMYPFGSRVLHNSAYFRYFADEHVPHPPSPSAVISEIRDSVYFITFGSFGLGCYSHMSYEANYVSPLGLVGIRIGWRDGNTASCRTVDTRLLREIFNPQDSTWEQLQSSY